MAELTHLTTYLVDRLTAGAASDDDVAAAQQHAAGCAACRESLARAARDRDAFLARNPPDDRIAALRARPRPATRWPRWTVGIAVGIGCAVAVAVVVRPRTPEISGPVVMAKGGPALEVTARRASVGRTWIARSGDAFAAGDALQLTVEPAGLSLVLVFSVDAEGKTTFLIEEILRGRAALSSSFVLDASPEPELLLVVLSNRQISPAWVTDGVERAFATAGGRVESIDAATVLVGGDVVVRSFLVRKEPAR